MTTRIRRLCTLFVVFSVALPGFAVAGDDILQLRRDLEAERAKVEEARRALEAQTRILDTLQRRLGALEPDALKAMRGAGPGGVAVGNALPDVPPQQAQASAPASGVERVGAAPDETKPPPIAVLGDQGGIITRRGQWTVEPSFEFTHADRNRVLFRGIELVESVLVGVFDINESREDLLTAALGARFGITNRFEVGVRVPYIYRADRTVLAPIAGSGNNPQTQDFPAKGDGIGDIEATLRYQLTDGQNGWPFLIANIQTVVPTGSSPFGVRRDVSGAPLEAATGSGFWALSPSLTVILPSDPAVLFASLGYTYNFARHLNAQIGSQQIDYIRPGDAPSLNVGVGVSLNDRLSFNLGYAHTWAFSTKMTTRVIQTTNPLQPTLSAPADWSSRDLQVGRYLFGVSYRTSDTSTINWTVEIGATAEAPNVHTTVRIPFTF